MTEGEREKEHGKVYWLNLSFSQSLVSSLIQIFNLAK